MSNIKIDIGFAPIEEAFKSKTSERSEVVTEIHNDVLAKLTEIEKQLTEMFKKSIVDAE